MDLRKKIALTGTILLLSLTGCGKEEEEAAVPPRNVKYVEVGTSGNLLTAKFSGIVKGASESNVSFRVSGHLESKLVNLGSSVKKDETLAFLEATDYEINLAEANASYAEANANVTKAKADYGRYRELYLNDNISKSEYDNYKASYEAAQARMAVSQERIELANRQLSYTILKAPFDGMISNTFIEEGENVTQGQPVFVVISNEAPEVEVYIPEVYINLIKVGGKSQVKVDALPGATFNGTVTEIGSGMTGIGNSFPIKVRIDNPTTDIRSGMTAEATLGVENAHAGQIIVPLDAYAETNGVAYVYLIEDGDEKDVYKLKKQEIITGNLYGNDIEVLSGLKDGDKIVAAGITYVHDGESVRLVEAKN